MDTYEFREQIRKKLYAYAKEQVEEVKPASLQSFEEFSKVVDGEPVEEGCSGSKKKMRMKPKKKAY